MEGEVGVCNASIVRTRQLEDANPALCACEHPHSHLSVALPLRLMRPTFQRITHAFFTQSVRNLDGRSISSARSRCAQCTLRAQSQCLTEIQRP